MSWYCLQPTRSTDNVVSFYNVITNINYNRTFSRALTVWYEHHWYGNRIWVRPGLEMIVTVYWSIHVLLNYTVDSDLMSYTKTYLIEDTKTSDCVWLIHVSSASHNSHFFLTLACLPRFFSEESTGTCTWHK